MKRLAHFNRDDGAAAVVVVLLFAFVLFGLAALVVDVGSMYTTKRDAQNMADAAALAGVQDLPFSRDAARAAATSYLNLNNNHDFASNPEIEISSDDTSITVKVHPNAPTFFARMWGITSEQVNAKATAMVGSPNGYSHVMPFGVQAGAIPYGTDVTLTLAAGDALVPGNYQFLNIGNQGEHGQSDVNSLLASGGGSASLGACWTQTGHEGSLKWLKDWVEAGHDNGGLCDCTLEDVTELQNGRYVITHPECHRVIIVPLIQGLTTGSGGEEVQIVGFGFFFISQENTFGSGSKAGLTGEFIRVLNPDDMIGGIGQIRDDAIVYRLVD